MEELKRRFDAAQPEAVIVSRRTARSSTDTSGSFGPRSSPSMETSFSTRSASTTGPASPSSRTRASRALQEDGLPALGYHFRLDGRRSVRDADRLGRGHPAVVHARTRRGRHAVPRAFERRARPGRGSACPRDGRRGASPSSPAPITAMAIRGRPVRVCSRVRGLRRADRRARRENRLGELSTWDPVSPWRREGGQLLAVADALRRVSIGRRL